jgi:glycosyltransferase involved in cell wall biosynthesis
LSLECARSVAEAWESYRTPFKSMVHAMPDDSEGRLGRSRTRNMAVEANRDADWFFFIDADDLCNPSAFHSFEQARVLDPLVQAVFGAIETDRHGIIGENRYPLDWDKLLEYGARGTLSMGCFIRADVANAVKFNEDMDQAEDFDFYLRALNGRKWTKVAQPLVLIRRNLGNAGGPRGLKSSDWRGACQKVVDRWKAEA